MCLWSGVTISNGSLDKELQPKAVIGRVLIVRALLTNEWI